MSTLESQLVLHEGCVLKLYKDTMGLNSIGVGHNIDANGLPPKIRAYLAEHGSITHDMAIAMLHQDIEVCKAELDRYLPWWRTMCDIRQRVLIDVCFNIGIEKLQHFKDTLKSMQEKDYKSAAEHMLDSLWAHQVGQRAQRLAEMMRTGKDYA